MSIAMIASAVVLAAGTLSGPVGSAASGGAATDRPVAAVAHIVPAEDHDWEKCLRTKNRPKWCHDVGGNGLYLPPAVGRYEPGQSPYPVGGYVSSAPGEALAPLGGGYVSTPPGQAIPPVDDGYVSSPPGVAISPVG